MRIYEGSNYNYNYTLGFIIIITHDYDSFHLEPSQCTIFFELYTCAKKKRSHDSNVIGVMWIWQMRRNNKKQQCHLRRMSFGDESSQIPAVPTESWYIRVPSRKITIFNRKCIFRWSIFHCYVRLPECTTLCMRFSWISIFGGCRSRIFGGVFPARLIKCRFPAF